MHAFPNVVSGRPRCFRVKGELFNIIVESSSHLSSLLKKVHSQTSYTDYINVFFHSKIGSRKFIQKIETTSKDVATIIQSSRG